MIGWFALAAVVVVAALYYWRFDILIAWSRARCSLTIGWLNVRYGFKAMLTGFKRRRLERALARELEREKRGRP